MEKEKRTLMLSIITAIIVWGGLWGIFEATVGYLVHLLPISIGWFIWYPIACFFMFNVYRKTKRSRDVILVGVLAACIKLLNLFLPGRIDRVLNPAVSIIFEALTLAAVIFIYKHLTTGKKKSLIIRAISVLSMNTSWRILYALYLLFLVPDWIREISVISSTNALITFFVVHNLLTSLILFGGSIIIKYILQPIKIFENKLSGYLSSFSYKTSVGIKLTGALLLLGCNIVLELLI